LHELGSPEVCGKEMKRSFPLFVIAVISIYCSMAGAPQAAGAAEENKEKVTMIATQKKTSRTRSSHG